MKLSQGLFSTWLLTVTIFTSLVLSLSCCSDDTDGAPAPDASSSSSESAGPGEATTPAGDYAKPPQMVTAIKKGADEGKIVMIELYDETCEYCTAMDRVLAKENVKAALADLIHERIGVEDEGVIEHFGFTQSPSYIFFKTDGEFMGPFLDGYRSSRRFVAEIENFKLMAAGKPTEKLKKDFHRDFGKG